MYFFQRCKTFIDAVVVVCGLIESIVKWCPVRELLNSTFKEGPPSVSQKCIAHCVTQCASTRYYIMHFFCSEKERYVTVFTDKVTIGTEGLKTSFPCIFRPNGGAVWDWCLFILPFFSRVYPVPPGHFLLLTSSRSTQSVHVLREFYPRQSFSSELRLNKYKWRRSYKRERESWLSLAAG